MELSLWVSDLCNFMILQIVICLYIYIKNNQSSSQPRMQKKNDQLKGKNLFKNIKLHSKISRLWVACLEIYMISQSLRKSFTIAPETV